MGSLGVEQAINASLPGGIAEKLTSPASVNGDCEDGPLGYGFEDQQTIAQLELIDDLQKLGVSQYLNLPQLVVVGDQRKSSVLQAVTDIPFSIDDKMCTRFATEIVLQRTAPDHPTEIDVCIQPDPDISPERRQELLSWRPIPFDRTATLDKTMMQNIFQQADDMIFGSTVRRNSPKHGRVNRLSSSILKITRRGPKERNFAIADIPGLVRGNESNSEHRTAKNLVQNYLNNPRSIVMAVIDVVDLERQEIMQMIQQLPDEETRVIGVINKCDTKQLKSHDWVFDLLRNDPARSPHWLKEGWFGLRNRSPSELSISDRERDKKEDEFFAGPEWSSLQKDALGRHALKTALIKMRNRHVKRSIPDLIFEIQSKLDECLLQIQQLGEPRATNQAQFTIVNKIATEYSKGAAGAVNGHYEELTLDKQFARKLIRDNLDSFKADMVARGLKIPFITSKQDAVAVSKCTHESEWGPKLLENYSWVQACINNYRGKEDIGEVNSIVKSQLWKQQVASWEEIASNALNLVERTVENVTSSLFEKVCSDESLRLKLRVWLQDDVQKAAENARIELQRLIASERDGQLFTLHPMMVFRTQQLHQERIQAVLTECTLKEPKMSLQQAGSTPLKLGSIPSDLIIQSLLIGNAELAGVLKTHDSLAAYHEVALYRFIDNFALQVVERHLLGPDGPLLLFTSDYVTQRLYGKENEAALATLAGEDPTISQKRQDLNAKRESLEESKKRVQSFKIL
ncbi:uncharacterized protein LY89DRAFT_726947 [Mollisia scopiformis]|uniref:GED domain-containing protein n=1 Tax=Mollisia scopiformis TaxID=149040 RepID=A0A194XUT1_MOLSC|nr:uncharacterized protein LY89DRAFT_726947 [Mollisia scopiformis]KUJ23896.1 hypothetical protein LY89DRAFT_726947 [Mollisia scopiformis]